MPSWDFFALIIWFYREKRTLNQVVNECPKKIVWTLPSTSCGWGIKKPNQAGLKYKVWPGFRFFCMKKGEVKKTNWIGNWLEKTQNLVHYKHLCSTFTSSSSNVVQTLLVLHMSEVDYSTLKFLAGNRRRSSGRAIALLLKSGMV